MAKFIQICASQNDLFALDEEGDIHRYDFKVRTWGKLTAGRRSEEATPGNGGWRPAAGAAMLSGELLLTR